MMTKTYFGNNFFTKLIINSLLFFSKSEKIKREEYPLRNQMYLIDDRIYVANKTHYSYIPVPWSWDFAIFQNHGYQGLYGGLDAKGIHQKKGLKKSQQILDHMGSTELAANLFRATQAEEKLRREGIKGKQKANQAHYEVGAKVRQTIEDLGGTMPEELPTPKTSTKTLEKQHKHWILDVNKKWVEVDRSLSAEIKNPYTIKKTYTYKRKCGEVQKSPVSVIVEKREWRNILLKFLPFPRMVKEEIWVRFEKEIGEGVDSWKGGTIGAGMVIEKGETPEQCLDRMERTMRFDR